MGNFSSGGSGRIKRKGRKTTGSRCSDIDQPRDAQTGKESGGTKGKVFLVGAGPGDPLLITWKGLECIKRGDLIVYDHLVNPHLLRHSRKKAEKVYAGKVAGKHALPQEKINRLLAEAAENGKIVCRLKGGDPFVFGRGGEEAEYLSAKGIPFEIVPGVTSAIAALAYAGIPLTHRKMASTAVFVTGNESPDKPSSTIAWKKISTGADTLVFLMGVKNISKIAARLMKEGRSPNTPAAVIEWGTLPRQRCVEGPLREIAALARKEKVRAPAIIVVGQVAGLRGRLSWFEKKPLFGRRILVTRATSQAGGMTRMIEDVGGEAVEFPTIRIEPPDDYEEVDEAIEEVSSYDWIVFTSVNGVRAFFSRMHKLGKDARCLGGVGICSIGPRTSKALRRRDLVPEVQPKRFSSEGIVEEFRRLDELRGKKVLLVRSDLADDTLSSAIAALGAEVQSIVCYRTAMAEPDTSVVRMLRDGKIDAVTFTSASAARNFAAILGSDVKKIPPRTVFASIGPVTTRAAREAGLHVHIEAAEYTIPHMISALAAYFQGDSASD